jgi:4-hydroxy-3-polyprenylbenzoate decarboxylase
LRWVEDGPVLENIKTGDEVNVLSFPAPLWHERDGGRYIGTGSFNITQDPDEGWVNLGTYRVMVHDEKTVGFYISPGKHGRIHRDKYMGRNEPMPAAVALGGDPFLFLTKECVPANEISLIKFHAKVEASFVRSMLCGNISTPVPVPFLQSERVNTPVA